MRSLIAVPSLLLTAALLVGCADDDPGTDAGSDPTTSPTTASPTDMASDMKTDMKTEIESPMSAGSTIRVDESEFGPMLFDEDGRAIYMWEVETSTEAECYGDCAAAWPAVLTDGDPVAGEGVKAALLGTTKRTDGATQVTYGGHPLYLYAHEGPGEVKCHNVATHGGLWWVVMPSAEPAPA